RLAATGLVKGRRSGAARHGRASRGRRRLWPGDRSAGPPPAPPASSRRFLSGPRRLNCRCRRHLRERDLLSPGSAGPDTPRGGTRRPTGPAGWRGTGSTARPFPSAAAGLLAPVPAKEAGAPSKPPWRWQSKPDGKGETLGSGRTHAAKPASSSLDVETYKRLPARFCSHPRGILDACGKIWIL